MTTYSSTIIARLDVLIVIDLVFYVVHRWIEEKQVTLAVAPKLSKIVNIYYSIWSLLWMIPCLYALPASYEWIFNPQLLRSTVPNTSMVDLLFFGYYLSKFHEYIDIILFLLARKFQLHPHFRYHHLTTPFFAYHFLHYQCGHHAVFMVANLFMHALVYFYLGGYRPRILNRMCRIWGHFQLFLGIGVSFYSLWGRLTEAGCECGSIWSDLVPLGLYIMYFILYQYEIYWPWPPVQKNKQK